MNARPYSTENELMALARERDKARDAGRRMYRQGVAWGLVCGAVLGVCTTGLAVLLIRAAIEAFAQ